MGVPYCTRESVKAAVDVKNTAAANAQIDRLIESAARNIERLCHRVFWPWTGTRYFDWPDQTSPTSWRLWLAQNELISLTAVTAAGDAVLLADVLLEPSNDGPPYNRVELDRSGTGSWTSGDTPQRNIGLTGVYAGAPVEERPVAALAEALDASETLVDVTDGSLLGVGSLLRVDSERLLVTDRRPITLGVTLAAELDDQRNAVTLTLSASTGAIQPGEVLLIDGERMQVVDSTGTTCTVTRAADGSTLATHLVGAIVYSYRTLVVTRGAAGTTAAAHDTAAPIVEWVPPGPVQALAVAEVLNSIAQENSAYVRVVGTGEGQRNASGAGLADVRSQVYDGYGRKARTGAV